MSIRHTDFRPVKRPRYVPSSRPPRKFPLIRILLLIALAVFVYTRFDTLWSTASEKFHPATVWHKVTGPLFGKDDKPGRLTLAWNADSSRVTLTCPRGLDAACCESLATVNESLCGTAAAVLEKARWKGVLSRTPASQRPLHLEAHTVVSDLGAWGHELTGVRGEDPSGTFAYRLAGRAGPGPTSGGSARSWCDSRRGCLSRAAAREPLADARLLSPLSGTDPVHGGATIVHWIAPTSRVRAILPGRVVAVASGGGAAGVSVRVYHGTELYASYGPLTPAPGVSPGALVKTGSYLGDAPAAAGGYRLTMRLRQGGQPLDPTALWEQAARRAFMPLPVADTGVRLAGKTP